jgi:hypothetical protein
MLTADGAIARIFADKALPAEIGVKALTPCHERSMYQLNVAGIGRVVSVKRSGQLAIRCGPDRADQGPDARVVFAARTKRAATPAPGPSLRLSGRPATKGHSASIHVF